MNVVRATILKCLLFRNSNKIRPKFIKNPRNLQLPTLINHRKTNNNSNIQWILPIFSSIPLLLINNRIKENLELQKDVEENILHLIALAQLALSKGELDRAENILLQSLEISDEYENDFAIAYIYDILAAIAFGQRNYPKCELILVEAIERLTQMGIGESNNRMIDFKLRLARIASANNEKDLADIGFQYCLNRQKTKIINGDTSTETGLLYINILYWFGYHKIRNSEYTAAKKLIDTAYSFSLKIKSLSAFQEMVILYTIADLYFKLGNYNLALFNMESALLLAKGIGSAELPGFYVKLAKIYLKMELLENALLNVTEALKLAQLFNEQDVIVEAKHILQEIKTKK